MNYEKIKEVAIASGLGAELGLVRLNASDIARRKWIDRVRANGGTINSLEGVAIRVDEKDLEDAFLEFGICLPTVTVPDKKLYQVWRDVECERFIKALQLVRHKNNPSLPNPIIEEEIKNEDDLIDKWRMVARQANLLPEFDYICKRIKTYHLSDCAKRWKENGAMIGADGKFIINKASIVLALDMYGAQWDRTKEEWKLTYDISILVQSLKNIQDNLNISGKRKWDNENILDKTEHYKIEFERGVFLDYYKRKNSGKSYISKTSSCSFWLTDKEYKMRINSCDNSDYWYADKIGQVVTIIHCSTFCAISKTEIGKGKFHYGYICYYDLEHIDE